MSIRPVLGSRASIGGPLGSGRGGAAAAWYLAGGVSAANCVAAYQPIGAVSLAASYTNLANPGVYTAAPGVAPTFAAATGWTFAAGQYLNIGSPITGTGARSVIVRYTSSITTTAAIVSLNVSASADLSDWTITPEIALRISGGNRIWTSGATTSNVVVAVTGPAAGSTSNLMAYKNGSALSPSSTAAAAYNTGSAGGAINRASFASAFQFNGLIQAAAIYNIELSAAQVAAISAAMAAL